VAYQIERITRHVQQMPLEDTSTGLSESQRTIFAIRNDLTLADVNKLSNVVSKKGMRTQLQRLLKRTETGTDHLSDLINKTYFEHTVRTDR
ncbi:MAG: alpha-E domain-containing protein, partial [Pseudomonadales bacterium]